MSRLRELRIHGFKSFADSTRFVFEPGVNAVIGPNGSGKSNMADAVRWVLGEQSNRSLRTRRADDVIFGGSDQRKPQGMAEAILTLDNQDGWLPIDFAEVSIGRRAYRSGESEYLINGARARLRDVTELLGEGRLGATDLVVVGQGTVDAALSLRPEERRQLFEEAAGVKGLQVKRNEATVRLTRALDNLTRVSDLVAELKPQVRRLAMQAEHQQQHDELGTRAAALVQASHQRRERVARDALSDARRRAAAAEADLAAYRSAQQAGRAAVTAAEARYWAAEEASRAAAEARQEAREELIRLEGRVEAISRREQELRSALARDEAALAETDLALKAFVSSPAGDEIAPALAAAVDAEQRWRTTLDALAQADDALAASEEAVAELRARHSDLIASRARATEDAARHRTRLAHAQRERASAEAAMERALSNANAALDAESRAAASAAEAAATLERLTGERDAVQDAADMTRRETIELTERLGATRAELDALREPLDAGTRLGHRLSNAGWPTLLDAVSAPEESWPAVEAVVGGSLDSALLWTDEDPTREMEDARGAVRLLTPDDEGPGAGRAEAMAAVGADQTIAEWIGMANAPRAFSRTVLAPGLEALLAGWPRLPSGWAAVTTDGDIADARGIVIRGRADSAGGAAARTHARRRDLTAAVVDLERRFADAQRAAHAASEELRRVRAEHLAAREAHDEAERSARVAREARAAADGVVSRAAEAVAAVTAEAAALEATAPTDTATASALPEDDELVARQAAAAEARARRDALGQERDQARDAWAVARRAAEDVENRTAGMRSERAVLEGRLAQLIASVPGQRSAIEAVTAELEALRPSVESARARDRTADAAHRRAEDARAARRAELMALEREHGDTGTRLASLEQASHAAAVDASRLDEALAGLLREREVLMDGLPDAAPGSVAVSGEIEALDDATLETELRRVRRTLAQIGSVNPFAVEEHRELAARLEEMTGQDTDLRAAITSTQELIGTLDAEITTQFDAAFRAIADRFDEFCRLLFAGGSGALQMGDEADGDAPGGIEIVVRPPGKRLQRLAMLSGGERALTGVALLFAMLTVNPVPFCILDEVDAALDEANIGRFAEALRKLSESIDFVVITHNRATIEVADTIYGVTMTDAAVSRVLSLRLADLPVEVIA